MDYPLATGMPSCRLKITPPGRETIAVATFSFQESEFLNRPIA